MDIFQRDIQFKVKEEKDDSLKVTAHLTDRFHDLELSAVVRLSNYEILAATFKVHRGPSPRCQEIEPLASKLVGIKIAGGFNKKVRELFSGPQGCSNLRDMVLMALPLVINSSWYYYQERDSLSESDVAAMAERDMAGHCLAYPR